MQGTLFQPLRSFSQNEFSLPGKLTGESTLKSSFWVIQDFTYLNTNCLYSYRSQVRPIGFVFHFFVIHFFKAWLSSKNPKSEVFLRKLSEKLPHKQLESVAIKLGQIPKPHIWLWFVRLKLMLNFWKCPFRNQMNWNEGYF